MTAELSILLKATAILVSGLVAARVAGRARASLRHLILAGTFAALLLLPIIAAVGPALTVEVPAASRLRAIAMSPPPQDLLAPSVPSVPRATAPAPGVWIPSMMTLVRSVWMSGVVIALGAARRVTLESPPHSPIRASLDGRRGVRPRTMAGRTRPQVTGTAIRS